MSGERFNRRVSILKPQEEMTAANPNMNKTKNDRRVSFHNVRSVQQYDKDYLKFDYAEKQEYFSMSSVSSGDELTRQHARNAAQQHPALTGLENDENAEIVERSFGGRRKSRQSLGVDDTKIMFAGKGHDTANLTLQFGARPQVDETFCEDNTQALFPSKTPMDQTNTEAFFGEIQRRVPSTELGMKGNDTTNNDVTEDFMDNIASQAQNSQNDKRNMTPIVQKNADDSLLGMLSPQEPSHFNEYEMRETIGVHSTQNPCLEQTELKSFIPFRDDTVFHNGNSPTLATSFRTEISSYVLHESITADQCKSLREGTNLPSINRNAQLSFIFDNTINDHMNVENEEMNVENKEINDNQENDSLVDISRQVTLYDNPLDNYQKPITYENNQHQITSTGNFVLEDSHVLATGNEMDFTQEQIHESQVSDVQQPTSVTQEIIFEDSRVLMSLAGDQIDQDMESQVSPAYMAQDFTLEESHFLKDGEQLAEDFNRTVEMSEEGSDQPVGSQLGQTYAVGSVTPDHTYLVMTPVVKSKAIVMDSILDLSVLSNASETLNKKLNETVDKLDSIEKKVENRRVSASFRQILAEATLNRSIAQASSPKVDSSNCPPLKQARFFDKSIECNSPRSNSVAIPTATEKTPKPSVRKSQQFKPTNTLQLLSANRSVYRQTHDVSTMSTPTRHVSTTPQEPLSTQRRKSMAAALIANTPLPTIREGVDLNPMHGPISLKAVDHIRWAQQLSYNPNWLNGVRVPRWNPLDEDHFDLHESTTGIQKDEYRQRAVRIVVQSINKFEGKMDFVRRDILTQGLRQLEQIKSDKENMWNLKEKHDKLIEHHNKLVDQYNYLIEVAVEKRHAENEKFISDVKDRIQVVISELMST